MLSGDIEIITPQTGTDDELKELVQDVEVIVSTRLSSDVVKAAKRLRFIQKTGAGVDAMPFDAIDDGVLMSNTSGADPTRLAEGAVALLLSLAKRIVERNSEFMKGRIGPGVLLRGKKVGILGLGSIGSDVARMLRCFGMKILALKRNPSEGLMEHIDLDFLGGPNDLHHLLRESDFVVVTLPLTPETKGMIGEKELRLMKSTAYLVNVARALLIQEEPLYRALKEGWIAGAALDVWWTPHWWDPIWNPEGKDPLEYPFWELPNVIATPHQIGSTRSRSDAAVRIMVENIKRIAEGKLPINLVNKKLQY